MLLRSVSELLTEVWSDLGYMLYTKSFLSLNGMSWHKTDCYILKILFVLSFAPSAPLERGTLFQDHGRFQS